MNRLQRLNGVRGGVVTLPVNLGRLIQDKKRGPELQRQEGSLNRINLVYRVSVQGCQPVDYCGNPALGC